MTLFLIRYLFQRSNEKEVISELVKSGRFREICEIREALLLKSHDTYDILVVKEFIMQEEPDLARNYIKKFRPNPVSGVECVFEDNEYIQWIKDYYKKLNK